eukprot:7331398-Pyramimonas_sp.AAC.1
MARAISYETCHLNNVYYNMQYVLQEVDGATKQRHAYVSQSAQSIGAKSRNKRRSGTTPWGYRRRVYALHPRTIGSRSGYMPSTLARLAPDLGICPPPSHSVHHKVQSRASHQEGV